MLFDNMKWIIGEPLCVKSLGMQNNNIEQGADVVVWGPPTVFWRYSRSDFKVYDYRQENLPKENFYAVISSRHNNDLLIYPEIAPEYILDKNGVILAVVKYVE